MYISINNIYIYSSCKNFACDNIIENYLKAIYLNKNHFDDFFSKCFC